MSRLVQTLLRSCSHVATIQARGRFTTLAGEGSSWLQLQVTSTRTLDLQFYRRCSDSNGPWHPQTGEKAEKDAARTEASTTPPQSSQVAYIGQGDTLTTQESDHARGYNTTTSEDKYFNDESNASSRNDHNRNIVSEGDNWAFYGHPASTDKLSEDIITTENKSGYYEHDDIELDNTGTSKRSYYIKHIKDIAENDNFVDIRQSSFNVDKRQSWYNRKKEVHPNDHTQSDKISLAFPKNQELDPLEVPEDPNTYLLPSQVRKRDSDLLVKRIRACRSSEDVFDLLHTHREICGIHHNLAAVTSLMDMVMKGTDEAAKIRHSEEFKRFAQRLFKQSRQLDAEGSVAVLKGLTCLEVNAKSKLVQTILQMVRHQINDLDVNHILFLDFLLSKTKPSTPLSSALFTALPIILETKLDHRALADLNVHQLIKALSIFAKNGHHTAVKLMRRLSQSTNDLQDASVALSISWSLLDLTASKHKHIRLTQEEREDRNQILDHFLGVIAADMKVIPFDRLWNLMLRLSYEYSRSRGRSCYHEAFLYSFCQRALKQGLNFSEITHLLQTLFKMKYVSDDLVRHTVEVVVRQPEEIMKANSRSIMSLLCCLSISTHTLPHLTQALQTLMASWEKTITEDNYVKQPLLQLARYLLSLDYYHPRLMNFITNPHTLAQFMSQFESGDVNQLRLVFLDQDLRHIFKVPHPIPDSFLTPGKQLFSGRTPGKPTVLGTMLCKVMGENCLATDVLVEDANYIDHLVALDISGCPLQLYSGEENHNMRIEQLNIPPTATRLAVLNVKPSAIYQPGSKIGSQMRLRCRGLEASGYKVLLIFEGSLLSAPEDERLLQVVRQLRQAGVKLNEVPHMVTLGGSPHTFT